MNEATGKVVFVLLALLLGLGIAFELSYPGNCSFLEYLSKEVLNLDASVCSESTIFSRAG